jgi:hypothetical protein
MVGVPKLVRCYFDCPIGTLVGTAIAEDHVMVGVSKLARCYFDCPIGNLAGTAIAEAGFVIKVLYGGAKGILGTQRDLE